MVDGSLAVGSCHECATVGSACDGHPFLINGVGATRLLIDDSLALSGQRVIGVCFAGLGITRYGEGRNVRMNIPELELTGWRREVSTLYAAVRAVPKPERAHELWRAGRDELFRRHPQSPLPPGDPMRATGVPYWPYDPRLRFELPIVPPDEPNGLSLPTDGDGNTAMRLIGRVELPEPIGATLDVWWLRQYAGGLFLPVRDGTAGTESYGGGRYLLDTAKGADLGGDADSLVVDLNFLYHPSCRYDAQWQCPLAPAGNTISAPIRAGERL